MNFILRIYASPPNFSKILVLGAFLIGSIGASAQIPEGCNPDRPDYETCVFANFSPADDEALCEDFSFSYRFPQVPLCYEATGLSITPASAGAGTVSCEQEVSGCDPTACIRWRQFGLHRVTLFYECPGYSENRSRCILVSRKGYNYSQFELEDVQDCSGLYSGFRLIRSLTLQNGPVKNWRVEAWETDEMGNVIASTPYWYHGWFNGDIVEKYFDIYSNLYFLTDKVRYYRIKLLTSSACGSHEFLHPKVYVANPPVWNADFDINGEQMAVPIELYACNEAPMILNDRSTRNGCYNLPYWRVRITMEQADECGSSVPGTEIVKELSYYAYGGKFNLRTLFPTYAAQPGWYRVSYEMQGGWSAPYSAPMTRCVRISTLQESDAEFDLLAPGPNGGLFRIDRDPVNTTAPNTALGWLTGGIDYDVASNLNDIDAVRIEIWRTNSSGDIIATLCDHSQTVDPNFTAVNFNQITNPLFYFLNLTPQQREEYFFKVRFTVTNECGSFYKESYFRILNTDCPQCFEDGGSDNRSASGSESVGLNVSVLPNPASSNLVVLVQNEITENLQFEIFDLTGRKLLQQTISSNVATPVNIGELSSGILLWRVVSSTNQVAQGQVVKQ